MLILFIKKDLPAKEVDGALESSQNIKEYNIAKQPHPTSTKSTFCRVICILVERKSI